MSEAERIATKAEPLIKAYVDPVFAETCKRMGYQTDNGVLREVWQAAIQSERERCAKIADQWAKSKSCGQHDDNPCCHVRTGSSIADAIRRGEGV